MLMERYIIASKNIFHGSREKGDKVKSLKHDQDEGKLDLMGLFKVNFKKESIES
jgi:hypothetical protein